MQEENKKERYTSYKSYLEDTTKYKNSISESETAKKLKESQTRNHRQFYVNINSDTLFTDLVDRIHLFEEFGEVECKNYIVTKDPRMHKSNKPLTEAEIYKYLSSIDISYSSKSITRPLEVQVSYFNKMLIRMFIQDCLSDEQYTELERRLHESKKNSTRHTLQVV